MNFLKEVLSNNEMYIKNALMLGGYLFDYSLKANKIFFMDGNGGCLDKDTKIKYRITDSNGKNVNAKGGTIEMLYERFSNNTTPRGKGGYHLRSKKQDLRYFVPSINKYNSVFHNEILDVVKSGIKKCYKLVTNTGEEIIASADHKFYNGKKYISLKKLSVGDIVYVHNNIHWKNEVKPKRVSYKEVMVKYHPSNHIKIVNGCKYYRIKRCRAVIEANMNKMSYNDYIKELNNGNTNLLSLSSIYEIHHINHDKTDDRFENLVALHGTDHDKLHATENYNKMRFVVVPDTIKSIEYIGKRETYDIKCLYPHNNFIANNIVVHNSGKSTLINVYLMLWNENQISSLFLDDLVAKGFDKESLVTSRVNVSGEQKRSYLDTELIKLVSEGARISISRKFLKTVSIRLKTKLLITCNGMPKFSDASEGIARRLCITTFRNMYVPQDEYEEHKKKGELYMRSRRIKMQDRDLPEKFKLEKQAIFNVFLKALQELRERKYAFHTSITEIAQFKSDNDTVTEFLTGNYMLSEQTDASDWVTIQEVMNHYRQWYIDNVGTIHSLKLRTNELGRRVSELFGIISSDKKKIVKDIDGNLSKNRLYQLRRTAESFSDTEIILGVADGSLIPDKSDIEPAMLNFNN
jgi:hypothetical protein